MRRGRGRGGTTRGGGRGAARSAGGPQDGKRQPRIKATGKGLVKAVLSGDTLVLSGVQKPGEPYPPEREVTFSGILAPKFARNKNQKDDPWAWHSREFLRKKVLGRPVSFELVHRHEGKEGGRGRDYCNVKFEDQNLADLMVSSGWATVQPAKSEQKDQKIHPEKLALLALEKKAADLRLGVHNHQVSPADTQRFFPTVNAVELLEKFRNTPLPAIVDKVLDGSLIRVELLGDDSDPLKHYVIPLRLAGVECVPTPVPTGAIQPEKKKSGPPKWKKAPAPTDGDEEGEDEEADDEGEEKNQSWGPPPKPEKPQPFSVEAQKYVEARLLHRDVKVLLQGADGNHPQANLFGTLQFEKGNITEKLLEQGFGKYVKWTASLTGAPEKLVALEGEAKNRRLNLWQKWSPAKEAADEKSGPREFNAKVTQVLSGDRIAVELEDAKDPSAESGEEKRYSLASIRCPRLGSRGGPNEDWALDAREWLRKRIHGKKVRVVIEYEREPLPESTDPTKQQFVSLYINKQNVNEGLVEAGLARLAPHRRNEDRASNWDRLLSAEHKAQKGKVGLHGSTRPPLSAGIVDLTGFGGRGRGRGPRGGRGRGRGRGRESEAKEAWQPVGQERQEEEETKESFGGGGQSRARVFLSSLQKTQRQLALVEYVFSGSRFKLWVQGQNLICFFVLAGIRSPRNEHDGSPNEWTQKATEFVRQRILQKTVQIDTEEVDRNEVNFVGTIYYNNGQNLSVELLREGLASIWEPALRNSSQREAFEAAQKTAKEGKVGLWRNWVEPPPEEEHEENYDEEGEEEQQEEEEVESLRLREKAEVKVRVTEIVDACTFYASIVDDPNVSLVQAALTNFADDKTVTAEDVKSGKVFAGVFGNDGTYHRVRVEAKTTVDNQWRVLFIDYGNREVMDLENLRHLDEELARLPPTAHQMFLAALKAPGEGSEYFEPAGQAFSDLVWDRDMVAKVELVDQGKYHVTLKRPGSETTVNQYLLENAWVRVQPRPHRRLKDLGRGAGYTPLYKSMLEFEEVGRNTRKHIWEYGNVSDEEEDTRDDRGRVPSKKAKEKELKDKEEKRKAQADKERKLAERPRKADKGGGGGGGKGGKGGAAAAGGDKGKGGDKGGKKK